MTRLGQAFFEYGRRYSKPILKTAAVAAVGAVAVDKHRAWRSAPSAVERPLLSASIFQAKRSTPMPPSRTAVDGIIKKMGAAPVTSDDACPTMVRHPLTDLMLSKRLHLSDAEIATLRHFKQQVRIYIDVDQLDVLWRFYRATQESDTPLAAVYRDLSFKGFLQRLQTHRFKAAYLDGRLLVARNKGDRLDRALRGRHDDVVLNRKLLALIGTPLDRLGLCEDYLSLQEIALASLLMTAGPQVAVGDVRRELVLNSREEAVTDLQVAFDNAAKRPFIYIDSAGVECRDGVSLSLDLLGVARPVAPSEHWHEAIERMHASPFSVVADALFGDKPAYAYSEDECYKDPNFVRIVDRSGQAWMLSKSSYKHQMKLRIKQVLQIADRTMAEHDLGHSFNLAGMGLGFFGFSRATDLTESLAHEALLEVVSEVKLSHIRQINQLNWPTEVECKLMHETDGEYHPGVKRIAEINGITIASGYAHPFQGEIKAAGDWGGTNGSNDNAAMIGNEANIGLGGSLDSDMWRSLLMPYSLDPHKNPALLERIVATRSADDARVERMVAEPSAMSLTPKA